MDRLTEEDEDNDSEESERCLLRLLEASCGVNEGEVEGDGGVSIACVSREVRSRKCRPSAQQDGRIERR